MTNVPAEAKEDETSYAPKNLAVAYDGSLAAEQASMDAVLLGKR